jgi:hypothetical protein
VKISRTVLPDSALSICIVHIKKEQQMFKILKSSTYNALVKRAMDAEVDTRLWHKRSQEYRDKCNMMVLKYMPLQTETQIERERAAYVNRKESDIARDSRPDTTDHTVNTLILTGDFNDSYQPMPSESSSYSGSSCSSSSSDSSSSCDSSSSSSSD